jgi:hypothetical protein
MQVSTEAELLMVRHATSALIRVCRADKQSRTELQLQAVRVRLGLPWLLHAGRR